MPNILIVDDQQCIRELLSEELIREGYRVVSTGDAESVVGHLRFSWPDLVLLDLYLDGPDGWEVLRDIKSQDPHLPVVIFTAYDSFTDDPRLSQADGYVIKSIDLGELKQKIADVLRWKWASRPPLSEPEASGPEPLKPALARRQRNKLLPLKTRSGPGGDDFGGWRSFGDVSGKIA